MAAFDLESSPSILARTPAVIDVLLRDLPPELIIGTEGPGTWSPFEVVGHLIHGERTDWMPRAVHLLKHGEQLPFPVFDRFAQLEESKGRSLGELLDTFAQLRTGSLSQLASLQLTTRDLERTGTHPEFGRVTLGEHLSTWVAHDFDHVMQATRCIGRQYADSVGPWRRYLRVTNPVQ